MGGKKDTYTQSLRAWLDVLNKELRVWRNQKAKELHKAENERHGKLEIAYKSKLNKAFKSKKSKELMIEKLRFVRETNEGKHYVKFEGTVFTAQEFEKRVNLLFRENVEKLWEEQMKIEAAGEAKLFENNEPGESTIAILTKKLGEAGSGKGRDRKEKAIARNKNFKVRKVKK